MRKKTRVLVVLLATVLVVLCLEGVAFAQLRDNNAEADLPHGEAIHPMAKPTFLTAMPNCPMLETKGPEGEA